MKNAIYWLLTTGGLAVAAWRGTLAIYRYNEWQQWRHTDPSAAVLYAIDMWFEVSWMVAALIFAIVGLILLKHRAMRLRIAPRNEPNDI